MGAFFRYCKPESTGVFVRDPGASIYENIMARIKLGIGIEPRPSRLDGRAHLPFRSLSKQFHVINWLFVI